MDIAYRFVNYGEDLDPEPDTLALDVGMKTVPGVIDHHNDKRTVRKPVWERLQHAFDKFARLSVCCRR